jgi:estrogen-related receptor beta like 1
MAEDDRRRGDDGMEGGPGSSYQVFVIMEELLDKLKLLNYEETFCKQLGFKPFSR